MSEGLREWAADKIERWPLEKIKPYPRNARLHSEEQIEQIAASMQRFGVTSPVLVDEEGVLIYGHGRRAAAELLGIAELPVAIARGWSEDEKKAYRITDNQLALNSEWDVPLLKLELGELKLADFDMPVIGFGNRRLDVLLGNLQDAGDPQAMPEAPPDPVVRIGDMWALGPHRLLVGDATDRANWERLMRREKASMIFTDPPYGVSYEASSKFGMIAGDEKRRDELYKMLAKALGQMAERCSQEAGMYIWHASTTREDFAQAMKAVGIVERQYLIWVKPSMVLGHADYSWQHEPCFYASKAEASPAFYGDRTETTVWRVEQVVSDDVVTTVGNGIAVLDGAGNMLHIQSKAPKNKKMRQVRIAPGKRLLIAGSDRRDGTVWEVARDRESDRQHPTQKPVDLALRAIENSSQPGEIVIDGFVGSGSTLIGAHMTARRCFGMEMDPVYAEVCIQRWQEFADQNATLDGDGRDFTTIAAERRNEKGRHEAAPEVATAGQD